MDLVSSASRTPERSSMAFEAKSFVNVFEITSCICTQCS